MKIIKPITIWQNGVNVEANRMSLTVQDNLKDAASFYYTLYADDNAVINSGIAMGGEDYENWNNDADINNAAYEWVASKINVEITGDYVAPVIASKNEPIVDTLNEVAEPIAEELTVQDNLTVESDTKI
jgi:hypothetical protein